MKKYFLGICLMMVSGNSFSQIIITEVFSDTPYYEKLTTFNYSTQQLEQTKKHHWGEFIEIYNYSDRDLSLANWYIQDKVGTFWLPMDKVIKSGQLMVIAYSNLSYNTTPFTELFSQTKDKKDQIIFQNQMLLRNLRETVKLGYAAFDGQIPMNKSTVSWSYQSVSSNFVKNAWTQTDLCYSFNSYQLAPNNSYVSSPANPLDASYKPPIKHYEDIVRDEHSQYYAYLDWTDNVNALLNNSCNISINKIEQSPNGLYNSGTKCLGYDIAGNYITSNDCTGLNDVQQHQEYTYDELEEIKNSIVLYPNPSKSDNGYIVNISWDGPSLNKIFNLQIYTAGGQPVYNFVPINGSNTTSFSLQGQLPGAFIANFTLNTGQIISKNILKW